MTINAQPDANIVATAAGVYAKIADVESRYPGMKIAVVFDQRGFIQDAISALEHTAILGALLAVAVIFLFLHSWRSTIIVAVSLPVSVLGTLFAGYVLGYTLNIMTLGGLALAVGLIVDDAIVVIENIYRHMARGQTPLVAAETATAEIFSAVLASSVTVITVFVPLVLIPGLQGLLFTPFAVMVMVGVGLSLVVAVTQVPMLSSLLLKAPAHAGTNGEANGATNGSTNGVHTNGNGATKGGSLYHRFSTGFDRRYERFANWYSRILARAVDRPALVAGGALAILVVTMIMMFFGAVQTELFPASNSRYARFNLQMPTGTAVSVTNATAVDIENRMMKDPRVENLGVQVGQSGPVGGTTITNQANLSVTLKPGVSGNSAQQFVTQWTAALTGSRAAGKGRGTRPLTAEQIADIRKHFGAPIPGLQVFGRTIDIVQNIIARGQDALQIQIFGPDIDTLYNLAEFTAIPKLQAGIPGLQPPQPGITNAQPEIDVNVNRTMAAQLGVDTNTISQDIDIATAGEIASYMQINGTQYPIEVQLPPDQRRTLQTIQNLMIPVSTTPTGMVVNSAGAGQATAGLSSVSGNVQVNSGFSPVGNYTLQTMPLAELANIQFGTGPSQITRQNKQREIDINAGLNIPLGAAVTQSTDDHELDHAAARISLGLRPAGAAAGPNLLQPRADRRARRAADLHAAGFAVRIGASPAGDHDFRSTRRNRRRIRHRSAQSRLAARSPMYSTSRIRSWRSASQRSSACLMLVGIVVKNAILVVEFTNQLRERGMDARDAILHAAPMRFARFLMTTLATIGGMLPIALGIEAGSETQAPLGTVVIGGLIVSTTLSLIVVPTIYLWVARNIEPRMGGFHRGVEAHAPVSEEEFTRSSDQRDRVTTLRRKDLGKEQRRHRDADGDDDDARILLRHLTKELAPK